MPSSPTSLILSQQFLSEPQAVLRLRHIPSPRHREIVRAKGRVLHRLRNIFPVMDPREFVGGDRGREVLELLSSVLERDTLQPMLVERDLRQRLRR